MVRVSNAIAYATGIIIVINLGILFSIVVPQLASSPPSAGTLTICILVAVGAVGGVLVSVVGFVRRVVPSLYQQRWYRMIEDKRKRVVASLPYLFSPYQSYWCRMTEDERKRVGEIAMKKGYPLEIVVCELFRRSGFNVKRDVTIIGRSGIAYEVDLLAKRTGQVFLIEFKNFTVASPDVLAFGVEMLDLPKSRPMAHPIIISRGFTPKAAGIAKSSGVKLLDALTVSSLKESTPMIFLRKLKNLP